MILDKKLLKGLLFDRWGVKVFLFSDNNFMNEEVLLSYLEELAEKLEISVRDENINIQWLHLRYRAQLLMICQYF